MTRAARWLWKNGILSTFLAGLFAVLPIVITIGIPIKCIPLPGTDT